MSNSLWGEEFVIKETPKATKAVVAKIKAPKQKIASVTKKVVASSKNVSIKERLKVISEEVYRILGVYRDNTILITSKEELVKYIDRAISNGIISIDTETNNSLEPVSCTLVGPCIYTPGLKQAYIPLNHKDCETGIRLDNQLTEQDIAEQFSRLSNTLVVMHNGKFDYSVIKCTTGVVLRLDWDTQVGARVLDENEPAKLKWQYQDKIDRTIEKYDIEHLFEGIPNELIPPELFALYAATDAYITYMLYLWQKKQFEKTENKNLYSLFKNVEIPVLIPTAEMELTGVCIDKEYAHRLSTKYHKELDDLQLLIDEELSKYSDRIATWRLTDAANFKASKINSKGETVYLKSKSEQLNSPVMLSSNTQLSILLYDILGIQPEYKKGTKNTTVDEEALLKIYEKSQLSLCKLILDYRGLVKLINTYVDKLPQCVCEKDNRLHAHFNSYGADTGRFSSSEPNLQNIPSHNKSIRMMFVASPGYIMCGSDFSAQEPRLLAAYSQDKDMIAAYTEGKDLYAVIGTKVYNNSYWDNMEFTDKTKTVPNPQGKNRRKNCKSILLGLMYGRGAESIAEQIGKSLEEAQDIIDKFYKEFPNVRIWIDKTEADAKKNGYVEDLWGRRRRLPDIQLKPYEATTNKEVDVDFNPLLGVTLSTHSSVLNLLASYEEQAKRCKNFYEINALKKKALTNGITLKDNGGFISRAERQCVNARIQGGAASMSKRAMVAVYNDPVMKDLGFRLLIMVHDELIGECPINNIDKVKERLSYWMEESAKPECNIAMKCDAEEFTAWYLDEYTSMLHDEKKKLKSKGLSDDEIFEKLKLEYSESTEEQLRTLLSES